MENQEKEVVRPLHELYELLYERIKDLIRVRGLCLVITHLYEDDGLITEIELVKLSDHFKSQKPTEHVNKDFYDDDEYSGSTLWWHGSESTKNRKLFIRKMIEITKPQGNV